MAAPRPRLGAGHARRSLVVGRSPDGAHAADGGFPDDLLIAKMRQGAVGVKVERPSAARTNDLEADCDRRTIIEEGSEWQTGPCARSRLHSVLPTSTRSASLLRRVLAPLGDGPRDGFGRRHWLRHPAVADVLDRAAADGRRVPGDPHRLPGSRPCRRPGLPRGRRRPRARVAARATAVARVRPAPTTRRSYATPTATTSRRSPLPQPEPSRQTCAVSAEQRRPQTETAVRPAQPNVATKWLSTAVHRSCWDAGSVQVAR